MASLDPFGYGTHEVLNQAPAMADYDAYSHDPALGKILSIFDADWAALHASAVGKRVGSAPCKSWRSRPTATFLNCAHMIAGAVGSTGSSFILHGMNS